MAPKVTLSVFQRVRRVLRLIEHRPSAVSTQSTSSLLLDLPCELRLQIYDAVADLPVVNGPVARRTTQKPRKNPGRSTTTRLSIPWFCLTLVCKTIASEMQHHVLASGNRTYTLEVDNLEDYRILADKVTWRRIPCSPSDVRALRADLVLNYATHCWGCGGPMPILSHLYQVLNCFIHNGPVLTRRRPLATHIHLDALILQIHTINGDAQEDTEIYDQASVDMAKQELWRELKMYISMVVDQGVLFGAVDKILCRWADDDSNNEVECQWEVRSIPVSDMTEWNAYGFHWGVPGSSSLTPQARE
ncbi:hypothetical protein C8R45DRAFT_995247 [Mycena sanguinolenta]|nr:hypothetical protein C8R45DRAFT_995247 [Mycena sanguinolenta]